MIRLVPRGVRRWPCGFGPEVSPAVVRFAPNIRTSNPFTGSERSVRHVFKGEHQTDSQSVAAGVRGSSVNHKRTSGWPPKIL